MEIPTVPTLTVTTVHVVSLVILDSHWLVIMILHALANLIVMTDGIKIHLGVKTLTNALMVVTIAMMMQSVRTPTGRFNAPAGRVLPETGHFVQTSMIAAMNRARTTELVLMKSTPSLANVHQSITEKTAA